MAALKNTIKKIPLLGDIALYLYRKINKIPIFTTSEKYWESRYKLGGNSGAGSYDVFAEFKSEIINDFVKTKNIDTVIEFGCGDGNQLKYFEFKSYIGYDVSPTAISQCREMYKSDDTKRFEVLKAYNNDKVDLVLSLDVIYHLVENTVYFDYMKRLFSSSNEYVIIYSSNNNENNTSAHVKHRKFTDWIEQNITNFKLIKHIPNKHTSSPADFYIFQIIN